MAWVGTRATPKAAGLQWMLWPGRPRTEPSVGHGYKNAKRQQVVTGQSLRPGAIPAGAARSLSLGVSIFLLVVGAILTVAECQPDGTGEGVILATDRGHGG